MPTSSRRENRFIERFLSAYEDRSWEDCSVDWLDETTDGAIEALATRKSDGKTLAIEHTIIEPFKYEKADFALFKNDFLALENDTALLVPGYWIQVFVPVGILRGQRKPATRLAIVEAVRGWLKANRLSLPNGVSKHPFSSSTPAKGNLETVLNVRVVPLSGPGKIHIRRQQIESNLGQVIEKALKRKLPKLVQTLADRHILLLERQHMNLCPEGILDEIEKRRPKFSQLTSVDEIWVVETMFYDSDSYLRFEQYEGRTLVASLDFLGDTHLGEGDIMEWPRLVTQSIGEPAGGGRKESHEGSVS